MHKLYHSLQVLNYKLKKTFNPSAVKIRENEKYTNEYKYDDFSNDDDLTFIESNRLHNANEHSCYKNIIKRSESLYHIPTFKAESTKHLQNPYNANEYGIDNKDSGLFCNSNGIKEEAGKNFISSFHKTQERNINNSHGKSIENGLLFEYSGVSCSLNRTGRKSENTFMSSLYDSQKQGISFSNKKNNKDGLVYEDLGLLCNLEVSKRKTGKIIPLLRNNSKKTTKQSLSNINEDVLACELSEVSPKNNETKRKTRKSSLLSSFKKCPEERDKQLLHKNKSQKKSISLSENIKIVENPKYLPEYIPSAKEIREDLIFQARLQSFMELPQKLEGDLRICQDKTCQ